MERRIFLKTLRRRLDGAAQASAGDCPRFHPLEPSFGNTRGDLTRVFLERQADLGVLAEAVATRRDAEMAVECLLKDKGWTIACSSRLSWAQADGVRVARAVEAEFGLVEAWLAIAETGSVVLSAGGSERRDTSLLPPAVGFFVARSKLVARLGDVLRAFGDDRVDVPTCLTLVTGPSASADIVGVRTLGVHGPGEVHVWLIEDE